MATRAQRERRAGILAEALARGGEALRRQSTRHASGPDDAEDALQDACLEFLRYYDGPPGDHAVRYLSVSVRRRARTLGASVWRRHHAACVEITTTDALLCGEPRIAVPCERPGPAEQVERDERVSAFANALAALKPDERTALLLLGLGCTYREIAAGRAWTPTKVNRCLTEGRAALRARLQGGEIDRPGS